MPVAQQADVPSSPAKLQIQAQQRQEARRSRQHEHFFKHGKRPDLDHCHWCQLRAFPLQPDLPVTLINGTKDGEDLPADFRFISRSFFTHGAQPADPGACFGCECVDANDCMYSGCSCLEDLTPDDEDEKAHADSTDTDPENDEDEEILAWANQTQIRVPQSTRSREVKPVTYDLPPIPKNRKVKKFSYHARGSRRGLLTKDFYNRRPVAQPIYECHDKCHCDPATCPNRVVERGRTIQLQIFRTDNRGWGLRTMADLRAGQFVDCYLGEIIPHEVANDRRRNAVVSKRKDLYLFALDKFFDAEAVDPPRLLEVDGEFCSGPTRFINHSCDPNLRIFARVGAHANRNAHDLAFFAIKDVEKGEELTFDYIDGRLDDVDQDMSMLDDSQVEDGGRDRCLCGAANCRGWLW